jgi:hypothetical protein
MTPVFCLANSHAAWFLVSKVLLVSSPGVPYIVIGFSHRCLPHFLKSLEGGAIVCPVNTLKVLCTPVFFILEVRGPPTWFMYFSMTAEISFTLGFDAPLLKSSTFSHPVFQFIIQSF